MGEDTDTFEGPAPRLTLQRWWAEGLRAGLLKMPRIGDADPSPVQFAVLLVLASLVSAAAQRTFVEGPAGFDYRVWLAGWWTLVPLLLAAWTFAPAGGRPWRFLALWQAAALPASLAGVAFYLVAGRAGLADTVGPARWPWVQWSVYLLVWSWLVLACFRAARSAFTARRAAVLAVVAMGAAFMHESLMPQPLWYSTAPPGADEPPRFELSQEGIEAQQAAFRRQVAGLAPERAGTVDVYGLVFAPYASEDVFLRESTMVAGVLADRFDAQGRVLHLVNHATTSATHGWATPLNLQRAVVALAQTMDRENDVLVVYLTSHGASNFRLAASHWPLDVDVTTPALLREALDKAGIRHRVVAISACYAGGWIEPLAGDTTLVMTAADAQHTSYGCGRKSELTFFGRAMFDEQLRKTRSFEQAFAAAVPVIRRREEEAGKPDGFSNPQIRVGEAIRPVLKALEARLAAGA